MLGMSSLRSFCNYLLMGFGEYGNVVTLWEAVLPKVPWIYELPRPPDQAQQVQAVWGKPGYGFVKANCDGAWVVQTNMGGVGWVIRDFVGWMLQAGGQGDLRYGSALAAEADVNHLGVDCLPARRFCSCHGGIRLSNRHPNGERRKTSGCRGRRFDFRYPGYD
ncbi:hypothetical protein L3X38_024828 [Prunus dulcis]|uniref:Uncharacterized protein n=1 Tax=Prunus dulcis TaxID=3755 RepID=A0AAD4W0H7_PRUDU|nr:hypothetical protein L3X38_024828 [Prunus dulcis]